MLKITRIYVIYVPPFEGKRVFSKEENQMCLFFSVSKFGIAPLLWSISFLLLLEFGIDYIDDYFYDHNSKNVSNKGIRLNESRKKNTG